MGMTSRAKSSADCFADVHLRTPVHPLVLRIVHCLDRARGLSPFCGGLPRCGIEGIRASSVGSRTAFSSRGNISRLRRTGGWGDYPAVRALRSDPRCGLEGICASRGGSRTKVLIPREDFLSPAANWWMGDYPAARALQSDPAGGIERLSRFARGSRTPRGSYPATPGGWGGIRTPGEFPHTRFPGVHNRPLCHPSFPGERAGHYSTLRLAWLLQKRFFTRPPRRARRPRAQGSRLRRSSPRR